MRNILLTSVAVACILSAGLIAQKVINNGPVPAPYVTAKADVVMVGTEEGGHGSGVVVSADGLILTNAHVAIDASTGEIPILFSDGKTANAVVMWMAQDYVHRYDLALLKVDWAAQHTKTGKLPFARIRAQELAVGEEVFAIGNPGPLHTTLTWGRVGSLHNDLSSEGASIDLLQLSLPIAPGSSGGGLFDRDGLLVGLTSAAMPEDRAISFAVPATDICEVFGHCL